MQFTIGHGISGAIITFFSWLGGLAGLALFLVYGILAIIGTTPFEHENLSLGITLVVLAVVGVGSLLGCIVGLISGAIVSLPCMVCCDYNLVGSRV